MTARGTLCAGCRSCCLWVKLNKSSIHTRAQLHPCHITKGTALPPNHVTSTNCITKPCHFNFIRRSRCRSHLLLTGIPVTVVLMGVSGSGKSTIGQMLSKVVNMEFLDADDLHPPLNKEKMHHGTPLSDEDRVPWLQLLRHALLARLCQGRPLTLACSTLQEYHREILRSADPDYKLGRFSCRVKFVLLDVGPEVLAARLEARAAEGKHFMPPSLLQSQLDLLRIHEAEGVFKVNAALSPQAIVSEIEDWLGPTMSRYLHPLLSNLVIVFICILCERESDLYWSSSLFLRCD